MRKSQLNHYPWYEVLSYYHRACLSETNDTCAIVFDIDGTLIDPRVMQLVVLKAYDEVYETSWFDDKGLNDLTIYEMYIRQQLLKWEIPATKINHICEFYYENHWSEKTVLETATLYPELSDLMKQLFDCSQTDVFFCTGRPEFMRELTIANLHKILPSYKDQITNYNLHMNSRDWEYVVQEKRRSMEQLISRNNVIAFVDNEPSNLIGLTFLPKSCLLVHADTTYKAYQEMPERCLQMSNYINYRPLVDAVS